MRIVVMGQMTFGAKTLEALLDKGEDVVGVYARANSPGVQEDILATLAKESASDSSDACTSKRYVPRASVRG